MSTVHVPCETGFQPEAHGTLFAMVRLFENMSLSVCDERPLPFELFSTVRAAKWQLHLMSQPMCVQSFVIGKLDMADNA